MHTTKKPQLYMLKNAPTSNVESPDLRCEKPQLKLLKCPDSRCDAKKEKPTHVMKKPKLALIKSPKLQHESAPTCNEKAIQFVMQQVLANKDASSFLCCFIVVDVSLSSRRSSSLFLPS